MPRQPFTTTIAQAGIGLLVIALIWEVAARMSATPNFGMPPLSVAAATALELLADAKLGVHLRDSFLAFVLGFVPAAVIAVPVGLMLRADAGARMALAPFALVLGAAPLVALAPMFVIWYGLGLPAKVALVFCMSVTAILNAMMTVHLRSAVPNSPSSQARDLGRSSAIFAGLRLGVLFGITGLVIMEMIASNTGLGFFLLESYQTFNMSHVGAGMLLLMLPTIIVVVVLHALELQLAP